MAEYCIREELYGGRARRQRDWVRSLVDRWSVDSLPMRARLKADGTPDMRIKENKVWLAAAELAEERRCRAHNEALQAQGVVVWRPGPRANHPS